jgi:hypothetical protein
MFQITQNQIDKINELLDHGLPTGLGTPEPGKMCVEAAISYALGLKHSDDPGCVMESLRRLKIRLNDSSYWTSNKARAEGLRRLAIAQLGSKGMDEKEFAGRVAEMTIQTVVPSALRSAAKKLTGEHATKLLLLASRCEQEPTEENASAAYANAADAAAYAATAAAYAANAASAAYATAAYVAADAADAATYAAAAAADAANAATYAAAEQILITFAENVVQILIKMKAPGCEWL